MEITAMLGFLIFTFSIFSSNIRKNSCWLSEEWMLLQGIGTANQSKGYSVNHEQLIIAQVSEALTVSFHWNHYPPRAGLYRAGHFSPGHI